jgi:hypothetical protein
MIIPSAGGPFGTVKASPKAPAPLSAAKRIDSGDLLLTACY